MTPTRTRRSLTVAAAVASAAALALGACSAGGAPASTSTGGGGGGAGDNSGYTIPMVTHETPGRHLLGQDQGRRQPGRHRTTGSTLKYSNDPDPGKQAQLIQNAVDSKVDGIATTLVTPDALAGAVKSATDAGIPRGRFNSGIDQYKDLGALMYFGSDENLAGEATGKRIAAAGGKKPLCVIQAAGSVALEARCAGVKKGSGHREHPGQRRRRPRRSSRPAGQAAQDNVDRLDRHPRRPDRPGRMKAMDAAGSSAKLATFDLNVDAAQAIKDGKIQFSVDQQPYVQGYLAVQSLYLNKKNGNDIGGGMAGAHRTVLRGLYEHRQDPPVRAEQHPLTARGGRPVRAGPRASLTSRQRTERSMSQTVTTPPAAPTEASNRVTLGWSNRLLARPEVGAPSRPSSSSSSS